MKNRFLIIASETGTLRNAALRKRMARLRSSLGDFDFACLNVGPYDTGQLDGMRMLNAGDRKTVNGYGWLPDITALVRRENASVVYFDSFLVAYEYLPLIRSIRPDTCIILDSYTTDDLRADIFGRNTLRVQMFQSSLKSREMESLGGAAPAGVDGPRAGARPGPRR
jgi:hypothetical protein